MRSTTRLHNLSIALITVTVLLCIGCEYRPGRGPARVDPRAEELPAWVTSPPSDTHIVYAVGSAVPNDRASAVAEARKSLAKQLRITIDDNGDEVEDISLPPGTQQPATLHVKTFDLPDVKIVKLEQTTHALFVLLSFDRAAWATGLRQRIRDVDDRIQDALARPAEARSVLVAAAKRHQLLRPLVNERDELYARLLVAEPATEIASCALTTERLRNELATAASGHRVQLALDSHLEPAERNMVAALVRMGFQTQTNASGATLRLDLRLIQDARRIDGMERVEGTFVATVYRVSDGSLLGNISIRRRVNGLEVSIARDRLLNRLVEDWREYLDSEFINCLTRL